MDLTRKVHTLQGGEMHILLQDNVFSYSNLGFCFFHNGTHLLKLNKKNFFYARTNITEAERLINKYPTFFIDPSKKDGGKTYEQSIIDCSVVPEKIEQLYT